MRDDILFEDTEHEVLTDWRRNEEDIKERIVEI